MYRLVPTLKLLLPLKVTAARVTPAVARTDRRGRIKHGFIGVNGNKFRYPTGSSRTWMRMDANFSKKEKSPQDAKTQLEFFQGIAQRTDNRTHGVKGKQELAKPADCV